MFPKSHYTANGKYPSLGSGYNNKRGHYLDPFWENQTNRWKPMIDGAENLREHIVAMNTYANLNCQYFRHFELPNQGIMNVYGDSNFATTELSLLQDSINNSLPELHVSEKYHAGQGMYGFTVHLVSVPDGKEVDTLSKLVAVVNDCQSRMQLKI